MGKKKKKGKVVQLPLSPENYIRSRARSLPLFECMISEGWKESGMASILIARNHINGNITFGIYLVDLYCLGVKDTLYQFNISRSEYKELKNDLEYEEKIIPCDYVLAHNIIFGALEFAGEFGFDPHKDFDKVTNYILEKDDDTIELMDIEFGRNGKPCIITEVDKKPANVIAQLEKTAGHGNYEVIFMDKEGYYFDDVEEEGEEKNEDDEYWKEIHDELEEIGSWNEADWKEFREGKKEVSDKTMLEFMNYFFHAGFNEDQIGKTREEVDIMMDFSISHEIFEESDLYAGFFSDDKLKVRIKEISDMRTSGKTKNVIPTLKTLIKKHPDNPFLYNELAVALEDKGKIRKSEDIVIYTYQKFPDNLFAKFSYLQYLILYNKFEEVAEILDNKWTLSELLPERKSFLPAEVFEFHTLLIQYYFRTGDLLKSDFILDALSNLLPGYSENRLDILLDQLNSAKLKFVIDLLDNEKKSKEVVQRISALQNHQNI